MSAKQGHSIPINPRVAAIPYGDRKRIKALTEGRTDLVDLMSGNPYAAMPASIRERLKAAIDAGANRYTDYWGSGDLRRRIARHLEERCGVRVDPDEELIVTHGVQEALYAVMATLLRPGDEVLIPTPHYANYLLDTVACGAQGAFVPLREEQGFVPDVGALERAITPRTRLLVYSNPNNPLGVTWGAETIAALAELARRRDLLVIADEIYRDFALPQAPPSIAALPGMGERTFTLNGFSKTYFMMGLRMGYLAGPAECIHHVKQLHYLLLLCPSSLGQQAALAALDCPEEELEPLRREMQEKLALLHAGVRELPGVRCVAPNGTFYLFPNIAGLGLPSVELAARLIEKAGVATLPGTEFGAAGEGHLRLSVVAPRDRVEEGLRRLRRYCEEEGDR